MRNLFGKPKRVVFALRGSGARSDHILFLRISVIANNAFSKTNSSIEAGHTLILSRSSGGESLYLGRSPVFVLAGGTSQDFAGLFTGSWSKLKKIKADRFGDLSGPNPSLST